MHIQTLPGTSSCRAAGRKIANGLHLPATQILQFRTAAVPLGGADIAAVPLVGVDIAAVQLGGDITTPSSCVAPITVRGSGTRSTRISSTEQGNPGRSLQHTAHQEEAAGQSRLITAQHFCSGRPVEVVASEGRCGHYYVYWAGY